MEVGEPFCNECGGRWLVCGPVWGGELQDKAFVRSVLRSMVGSNGDDNNNTVDCSGVSWDGGEKQGCGPRPGKEDHISRHADASGRLGPHNTRAMAAASSAPVLASAAQLCGLLSTVEVLLFAFGCSRGSGVC